MLIYASSCPRYFAVHGEAFIASAKQNGHQVKVDISDDFPELRPQLKTDHPGVFPCLLRLLRLPELLDKHDKILVLDVDSVVNDSISFDDGYDMALFFRFNATNRAHKILFTASYWTRAAKPFALRIRELLMKHKLDWMDGQEIVWKVYEEMGDRFKIKHLNQDFVCYDFDREAPIWTSKGPLRKKDPVYLERRNAYQ